MTNRRTKLLNWFIRTSVGSVAAAAGLVFLAGLFANEPTFEPGFLAVAAGILILIYSMATGRLSMITAILASLTSIASGALWMKSAPLSLNPNADTFAGIGLILALGLAVYGLIAFYFWIATRR